MTSLSETQIPPLSAPKPSEPPDLTGRSRMAWNVLISWAGQMVFIIAGFIMPRMIDGKLGQETLGIWDFSWTMLAYMGLLQVGVGDSVNRYVAKYRARGSIDLISGIVSSVTFLLCLAGLIVLGLTALISYLLPSLWGERFGVGITDAQAVLLALGSGLAVQIALGAFTGVITGCHRWDIHYYIKAGWHATTVVGMIVLLQSGFGIRSLAVAMFIGLVLADVTRIVCAFLLCPGMCLSLRLVQISMILDAFGFGVKTLSPRLGDLLLNQTSNILVASFLGPAALALYARPKSLVQHAGMLVSKLAFVLTPTASAMHSADQRTELGELLISSTRYAAFISLPITLGLSIMGGPLMLLWMGPDYVNGTLVALVALGSFATITSMPAMSILAGLNAHGRPGIAHLLGAVCSAGLVFFVLGYLRMGLIAVALAVGLPSLLVHGIYMITYACRQLGLSVSEFLSEVFGRPVSYSTPLFVCLAAFRLALPARPLCALWLGSATGGILLGVIYWRNVLPRRIKSRILQRLDMRHLFLQGRH